MHSAEYLDPTITHHLFRKVCKTVSTFLKTTIFEVNLVSFMLATVLNIANPLPDTSSITSWRFLLLETAGVLLLRQHYSVKVSRKVVENLVLHIILYFAALLIVWGRRGRLSYVPPAVIEKFVPLFLCRYSYQLLSAPVVCSEGSFAFPQVVQTDVQSLLCRILALLWNSIHHVTTTLENGTTPTSTEPLKFLPKWYSPLLEVLNWSFLPL